MAGPIQHKFIQIFSGMIFILVLSFFLQNTFQTNSLASNSHSTLQNLSAYVYPNPVRDGRIPTLVVEPGEADKITAEIFDPAGQLVYQSRVDDNAMETMDGKVVYKQSLHSNSLQPGVYGGLVKSYLNGEPFADKKFQFTVLR